MRKKVIVLSLILAIVIYGVLLIYVFAVSPSIKEKSISKWIQKEVSREPKYKEREICSECHFEVYKMLIEGNHSSLECEVCHGVGDKHTIYRTKESIRVDDSRDSCLVCHKSIPGRKAIATVGEDHYVGVKCVVCHNTHG